MSDTPRTDALLAQMDEWDDMMSTERDLATLARQLERELNDANRKIAAHWELHALIAAQEY